MYYNKEKNENVENLMEIVSDENFNFDTLFYLKFNETDEYICKFYVYYDEDEDMDINDPNYEFYFELCFFDIITDKAVIVNYKHFPIEIKMGEKIIYKK